MKHILKFTALAAIFIAVSSSFVNAQENALTNKKGVPILPTTGTWALGIDAAPFFRYAGDFIGSNPVTTPSFNGTTFFGKYFLSDNKALRFGATLNALSNSRITHEDKVGSTTGELVENIRKNSFVNINFFFGREKRVGTTRLQGFYGAQTSFGFGFADVKTVYIWGDTLRAGHGNWRPLLEKPGVKFSIGASAFAGVEYFIAPGISLGAQIGYGIGFDINGKRSTEIERRVADSWPALNGGKIEKQTVKTSGHADFNLGNFGGNINLIFHMNSSKIRHSKTTTIPGLE